MSSVRRQAQVTAAVTGCFAGAVVLARLTAVWYPDTDPLNRLYAGVFIPVIILCGTLCYSLLSAGWRGVFLRAWCWWLPLLLLPGVWL